MMRGDTVALIGRETIKKGFFITSDSPLTYPYWIEHKSREVICAALLFEPTPDLVETRMVLTEKALDKIDYLD